MAGISFKNVVKTYDNGVTVIPDLNLDINDKEFVVLVGPSGCGKSTTLRMIAGLEGVSDGELFIGDTLMNAVPPKERDIAMVFQNYALYPHMSVYKNMAFALNLQKRPKDEIDKKVKEAAEILGLTEYLDRKPKALSGGQRQRVALGRAMVRNPSVFLLDEPLSNLDAKLRTEMRSQISKLHKQLETTFVYVTHDQTEAMTMGDRICVMKDGVIQQFDTPQTLYNHPCNLFVAGFIGSPQMNFVDAVVEKADDGYELVFDNTRVPCSSEKLADYLGKTVVLGFRPEHLHAEPEFIKGGNVIEAVVDLDEMMGSETFLYMNYAGAKMIAKVPSKVIAPAGSNIALAIDVDQIHVFDKETEVALF
ncbi:MAG: sn-glycerol-3-phosphate ABC transporter ATP-binding protein UgpC [Firmicutes bacterium]|nr:sn-glycerol-3-phosphate ABC transporter ATP-binding protein UgpC [Bacillota bacterium]